MKRKMSELFRRTLCMLLCLTMLLTLVSCDNASTATDGQTGEQTTQEITTEEQPTEEPHTEYVYEENVELSELVLQEAEACFRYLWELAQTDESTGAYGLVRDRYPGSRNIASTAATGFALAAIPYGIEKGWITKEEGEERASKTMDTLLSLENFSGFFYHFINMLNGDRATGSEVSVIDTGILLCGAIVCGEYFGGEVEEKVQQVYDQIDWSFYLDSSRNMFYMSYSPEEGFGGAWDVYGEQLMLYVLSAGSSTYPLDKTPYYTFQRLKGSYAGYEFVHSWFGSIFTYQFSHAFIDFRGKVDEKGMDWYDNSVKATLAAREYCITNRIGSKTYSENSWGLTACDTIEGYDGLQGAPPSGGNSTAHKSNGHVATAGAIGSMPFAPEYCIAALENYMSYEKLVGDKYGLLDAYNLDKDWYASDYVGIDKGISLLMIANYESEIIWDLFMQNENVQAGMDVLGFTEKQ